MRHASVFIHSRNDLPASEVVAQAGEFTGPDFAFEAMINPISLKNLKVPPAQLVKDSPTMGASFDDSVLKLLAFVTCPPENLCVMMSHCNGAAYSEFDKVLLDSLSIDLQFSLDDVMIYPVQGGHVLQGVSYSQYFSGLKS